MTNGIEIEVSSNLSADVCSELRKAQRGFLWTGILLSALGIVALIMPYFSSLFVVVMLGVLLIAGGVLTILVALPMRQTSSFIWLMLNSVLSIIAGVYLLLFPDAGLIALTFLVASIILISGLAQLFLARELRRQSASWLWILASALIGIMLGILIMVVLTEVSNVLLGILIGVDFLSTGIALVALSRAVRRLPG